VFATGRIDDLVPLGYQQQKAVTAVRSHFLDWNEKNVEIQEPLISLSNFLKRYRHGMKNSVKRWPVPGTEPLTSQNNYCT